MLCLSIYRPPLCLQTLAKARVVSGNGSELIRGVFSIAPEDDLSGSAIVYVETPHPSMTLSFDTPKVYLASDLADASVVSSLPANLTDKYQPCTVIENHGYTGVWEVELPSNRSTDTLDINMCSPGGYDQVGLRLHPCCNSLTLPRLRFSRDACRAGCFTRIARCMHGRSVSFLVPHVAAGGVLLVSNVISVSCDNSVACIVDLQEHPCCASPNTDRLQPEAHFAKGSQMAWPKGLEHPDHCRECLD
jgi:hypothetical protein